MRMVAIKFRVIVAVLLCMSMTALVAMDEPARERIPEDAGCFPATRALCRIALENIRERFESMTRGQVVMGVMAVIGYVGINAFNSECAACNGNMFWFLNVTELANLFYGAGNQV